MPIFGIDTLKSERELDDLVAHPPQDGAHRVHRRTTPSARRR